MVKKNYITWEDFHSDVKSLAQKIKQSGDYTKIIAISRGGLLPAGILSYELDIRNSHAINISSYDGENQRSDNNIEIDSNFTDADSHTLIVDDLADSGKTIRILRKLYPQAIFVTVYAKPKGVEDVDIFAKMIPDEWVVFPWD